VRAGESALLKHAATSYDTVARLRDRKPCALPFLGLAPQALCYHLFRRLLGQRLP